MSKANTLAQSTITNICERLSLVEKNGPDGGPYRVLRRTGAGTPVGTVRIFGGEPLEKLVYIGLTVPEFHLDSHMLFAFAPATSPVPHFTVDAVWTGEYYAFHLDLLPRVDLGANLAYLDRVMNPLTEHWKAAQSIEGLTPAHLTPRQNALMSPWMLAYRATDTAFDRIPACVQAYRDHWISLFDAAVTTEAEPVALARRDRLNRDALFNPDVDPVWGRVERLIGAESGAELREILRGQERP